MSDERRWQDVAALAEMGVLSASLIHELRQPLFALRAMAELLLVQPESARERAEEMLAQARYAERLIQHYGSVGRTDEPVVLMDMNDPVRAGVEMLAYRARGAGVTLEFAPSARPVLVHGQPLTVKQVALNLIGNAIDAARGSDDSRVEVCTTRTEDAVGLLIYDSGPGVADDVMERLFEPFVTTKPVGAGTGLGLAITRERVQASGGRVWLEREGDRTLATVLWPAATTE